VSEPINSCGSNTAAITISVHPNPTVSIDGSDKPICKGETLTLSAFGANTYSWSNGQTTPSINVAPTSNATYTVVGINSAGCKNSAVFSVSVLVCQGVENIQALTQWNLYPNPFTNLIYLAIDKDLLIDKVWIQNTTGTIVYMNTSILENEKKIRIDLSDFSNGLYFIHLESKEGNSILKLVKE